MYRNVSLLPKTIDGKPSWILLGPNGLEVLAFSAFVHALRHKAENTIIAYCRHLAEFLDYLIEVVFHLGRTPTKAELIDAFEAYGDFLQMGTSATSSVTRAVATQLKPNANSSASLIPKKAAVRKFLKLSEILRKELEELGRIKVESTISVDVEPLLPDVGKRRELNSFEVRSMQANSMLAGVISGGPKLVDSMVMGTKVVAKPYDLCSAFPLDKALDLIDAMPTYRDEAWVSLCAASGGRGHEIWQVLMEDIDIEAPNVRLVSPMVRMEHPSYRSLTPEQRRKLAWKGRATDLTLLIEPFASRFFESLKMYFDKEYIAHGRHGFAFQLIAGSQRGLPFFLSAANTRIDVFNMACQKINVTLPPGVAVHSLRHMYATYLLNFFPRADGSYGLPMAMVQQLLGHANIKHTQKYAIYDQEILRLELEHANRAVYSRGEPKKFAQLKLEAIEHQVLKLKAQLGLE